MSQRQLRLGDILDDYCPRERRITNHAIVAMIGEDVRQTRCTTCESEHEYKQAKLPPQRRKRPADGVLYQQVLDGMPRKAVPAAAAPEEPAAPPPTESAASATPGPDEAEAPGEAETPIAAEGADRAGDGPVHRQLIRASFPRPVGEAPARREPEFTIHTLPVGRHGRFKPAFGRGGQGGHGQQAGAGRNRGRWAGGPGGGQPGGHSPHAGQHGHGRRAKGPHGRGGKKHSR